MQIEQMGEVLRMDQAILAWLFLRCELFQRLLAVFQAIAQKGVILALLQPWQ